MKVTGVEHFYLSLVVIIFILITPVMPRTPNPPGVTPPPFVKKTTTTSTTSTPSATSTTTTTTTSTTPTTKTTSTTPTTNITSKTTSTTARTNTTTTTTTTSTTPTTKTTSTTTTTKTTSTTPTTNITSKTTSTTARTNTTTTTTTTSTTPTTKTTSTTTRKTTSTTPTTNITSKTTSTTARTNTTTTTPATNTASKTTSTSTTTKTTSTTPTTKTSSKPTSTTPTTNTMSITPITKTTSTTPTTKTTSRTPTTKTTSTTPATKTTSTTPTTTKSKTTSTTPQTISTSTTPTTNTMSKTTSSMPQNTTTTHSTATKITTMSTSTPSTTGISSPTPTTITKSGYPVYPPNIEEAVFALDMEFVFYGELDTIIDNGLEDDVKHFYEQRLKELFTTIHSFKDLTVVQLVEGSVVIITETRFSVAIINTDDTNLTNIVEAVMEDVAGGVTDLNSPFLSIDQARTGQKLLEAKTRTEALNDCDAVGICPKISGCIYHSPNDVECLHTCGIHNPCGSHGECLYDELGDYATCRCEDSVAYAYYGSDCEDSLSKIWNTISIVSTSIGALLGAIKIVLMVYACVKKRRRGGGPLLGEEFQRGVEDGMRQACRNTLQYQRYCERRKNDGYNDVSVTTERATRFRNIADYRDGRGRFPHIPDDYRDEIGRLPQANNITGRSYTPHYDHGYYGRRENDYTDGSATADHEALQLVETAQECFGQAKMGSTSPWATIARRRLDEEWH